MPPAFELAAESGHVLLWRGDLEDAVRHVATAFADLPTGEAQGRAPLRRVESASGEAYLVRPYRKGGLARGVRGERFRGRFRPLDEAVLHAELQAAGVPVLEVGGAVVLGDEASWDGFLLTREAVGAVDVDAWLEGRDAGVHEGTSPLERAGAAVRALHEHGVEHADLHAKNLLLTPAGEVLVIDLDRARRHAAPLADEARVRNLARFERYLVKQRAKGRALARWTPAAFYRGYADGDDDAGQRWMARAVAQRGRLWWRSIWWRLSGQARSGEGA